MAAVKLAFASDLHVPITSMEGAAAVAREMADFGPDAVVLAGDLAETLPDLSALLTLFRERVGRPVWMLPGNHDLWTKPPYGSRQLWEERLPRLVVEAGCGWLEGAAFTLGDTAVAGTVAWYDYSAADPGIHEPPAVFAREKGYFNADAYRIDWQWTDPEFAGLVSAPFLATLDRLEADPAVRRVVAATHVPLLEGQMCRRPDDRRWAFSNAYFGNLTLGAKALTRRSITHVVSGHTHVGRRCVSAAAGRAAGGGMGDSERLRQAGVGRAEDRRGRGVLFRGGNGVMNSSSWPRAALFDMDGTLIDSFDAIAASVNHVRGLHGLPPLPLDEVKRWVGRGAAFLLQHTAPGDLDVNIAAYRAHHPSVLHSGTRLLPGAAELLRLLHGRGVRLGVCSNKPVDFTRDLVGFLGVAPLLDVVLGPEDVPRPKPAPDMLVEALRRLGVAAAEALYVGDIGVDVQTARGAGVTVWVVATGSEERGALERAAADRICADLCEVAALLPPLSPRGRGAGSEGE